LVELFSKGSTTKGKEMDSISGEGTSILRLRKTAKRHRPVRRIPDRTKLFGSTKVESE
jgi:hypothetical protein